MSAAALDRDICDGPLQNLIEADSRQRLCGGELLLRLRLANDEIASLTEPAPLFRLTKRLSYLPFVFNDVIEHFNTSLPPRLGAAYEIWFDYEGIPLKWYYPLGVLCDILVGVDVPSPLDLTVHFREPPRELLRVPYSNISSLEKVVLSSFRQAIYLEHNSHTLWQGVPKKQQTALWDAISNTDLEAFQSTLWPSAEQQARPLFYKNVLCDNLEKCSNLALRLHFCGQAQDTLLHKISPFQKDQKSLPSTVFSFLREVMPPLIDETAGEFIEGVQIVMHGVLVPADTPLYWLALHASCLDHFVHLVVRVPDTVAVTAVDN